MYVLWELLAIDLTGRRTLCFGTVFEDLKDALFKCDILDVWNWT
jgi:hypothetical protein